MQPKTPRSFGIQPIFARLWRSVTVSQKPKCNKQEETGASSYKNWSIYMRAYRAAPCFKSRVKRKWRRQRQLTQTCWAQRRSYSYEQQKLRCTSNQKFKMVYSVSPNITSGKFASTSLQRNSHEWLTLTLDGRCCRASTVSTNSICFSTAACNAWWDTKHGSKLLTASIHVHWKKLQQWYEFNKRRCNKDNWWHQGSKLKRWCQYRAVRT